MTRRANAIIIRAVELDEVGQKILALPAKWTCIYEDNDWVTLLHEDHPGKFLHAWLACELANGNGVWLILGPKAWINNVVALVARSWNNLQELRLDNTPVAQNVKAAWISKHGTTGPALVGQMSGFLDDDGEDNGDV